MNVTTCALTAPSVSGQSSRYSHRDRTITVRLATTRHLRNKILEMRSVYYKEILDKIGVPVWDKWDEIAVHFVCLEDGKAIASMRAMMNTDTWGEVADDFADL